MEETKNKQAVEEKKAKKLVEQIMETGIYEHPMSKPFTHDGETYTKLTLNLKDLTGADLMAVEQDLAARGIRITNPENSYHFLYLLAARAAKVPPNLIAKLPMSDANTLRHAVRLFL